ncbi:MAG: hypothetical protein ACERKD_13930 [Prolixibacteraceae bacterium]
MKPTVYQVQVRVFLKELQKFYEDNSDYGTLQKPYPANSFFEVICPKAKFWGPLKNILILDSDCTYQWSIVSKDGIPVTFSSADDSFMEFEMLSKDPSPQKWGKIFENPTMDKDKVKVKSTKKDNDFFELDTTLNIEPSVRLKYSFLFEFTDDSGDVKYGSIDPDGSTTPPPEP